MNLISIPTPDQCPQSPPTYGDHCLLLGTFPEPVRYPAHFTGLGIVAVLEGRARFTVNEEVMELDARSFCVVNRGSRLSFFTEQKNVKTAFLYFNYELSQLLIQQLFSPSSSTPFYQDFSLIEHVHFVNASLKAHLHLLIDLGQSCASFHHLKADMLVRSILEAVIAENLDAIQASAQLPVVKKSTRVDLFKRLAMVKSWMEQHYAEAVQLEDLARMALLNEEHFLRLFKQTFGLTPHQLLIELRIRRAGELLKTTDWPVAEICRQVGYVSVSSFSGRFKREMGLSPLKYRADHH